MVQIFLNHKKEFNTVTVKQAKFIVLDVFFFFFLISIMLDVNHLNQANPFITSLTITCFS